MIKIYFVLKAIVLFSSIILLIYLTFLDFDFSTEPFYSFVYTISLVSILLFFLYERIDKPFFLEISTINKNQIQIESFFSSFEKNIFFQKKYIKKIIIDEKSKLHINYKKKSLFVSTIFFSIQKKNGILYKSELFNTKWIGKKGLKIIEDLIAKRS